MASKYTTKYQLNQWQPTDAVQRLDFNADNAKIDGALSTLQQSITAETLLRTTAIQTEQQARAAAIQTEQQTRAAAIQAEQQARTAALNEHAQTLAVLTERAGAHLLASGSVSQDGAASISIPLPGIQWDEWKLVYLVFQVAVSDGQNSTYYCRINEDGYALFSAKSNHDGHTPYPLWTCAVLLPFFDGARRIMGFAIGLDTTEDYVFNFSINAPFDDVEGFQLTFPEDSGMTFQAGSMYQVFGEK